MLDLREISSACAFDTVSCGVGRDVVAADLIDIVSANCEVVRRR